MNLILACAMTALPALGAAIGVMVLLVCFGLLHARHGE